MRLKQVNWARHFEGHISQCFFFMRPDWFNFIGIVFYVSIITTRPYNFVQLIHFLDSEGSENQTRGLSSFVNTVHIYVNISHKYVIMVISWFFGKKPGPRF